MPIYRVNGKTYNIPDDKIDGFEARYPDATVEYHNEGKRYDIPLGKRAGFLSRYPNASYNPTPTDKSQNTFTSEQLGLQEESNEADGMITTERQVSTTTPMWGTISVGENRREAVKDLGSASSGQGGISEYIEMLSGVKSEGQKKAEEQMRIAKERAAKGERNWHPYGDTKKPFIESPDIRIGAADNVGLGSPYFNADIYADDAVRRAEEGLKPADGWTEATKRAQANIANRNRQAQIKKAAEDAVGELRIKSNELSRRYEEADAKRPKIAIGNPKIFGGVLTEQGYYDRDYRNLNAANNILKKTEDMMADFASKQENGRLYNLGRGLVTSTFNPDNWDFGFGDANVAERLLSVVEKADKDEPLSESEQLLLDAAINQQVMQGYYSELSGWQKAGKMFGESLPFMAQMAVNPLGSMSKYAGSKAAKAVLKHISKKVSKKAIERILARTAGLTAKTLGDLGTSYGMALTSNLGNTTADALNRQIGDIQYDYDDNGVARYNGRLNVKEAGEAWLAAANNQAFEFYSEQMGNYFAPILKGMGKLGGKVLDNFGMDGVNRWVSDFAKKGSVRQLNQFFDKTQFHGFASEYAEEIANGMLNAAFVGDMTMEDVFSKDNLIDTAIGLSVMGAIGPMVGTAGYARAKYKEKQALNAADEEGRRLMGHAWDSFADAVRRSKNGEELSANLRETLNSFGRKALPGEDMRQILSYAQAYNRYKAVEEVSAKAVAEGVMDERDLELQRQYENGQTTTDKHGLRVTFEAAADAVKDVIPLNIGENTAYDIADEYDEQGDADTATAIRVFLSARAAHSGMTAQIREQAQSEMESANAEIDSHTNKTDGNIYSVTLGGGLNGYVTGGTVITDSDGDIDIDATREANEGGYIYVNVDGVVKPKSVDDFVSLDGVESAADAKAAREAEINAALNAQYEELTAPVETQEATPASTEVTPESAAPAETAAVPVNNAPTVSEVAENAARALGVLPEELEEVILDEQEGLERAARYSNIGDTDSADAIRAYVAERFGTPAVQPAQVNNATAAEVGNNGGENILENGNNGAENIPAEQAPENVAPIPVEKRGKEERQAFHLVPVERTTEELYNSGLTQQEIDAFVQANIDEINSDIEKHSKKQPKMGANIAAYKAAKEEWQAQNEDLAARLNYYKALQDHIKGITTSNTAEAINDPIADVQGGGQNGVAQEKVQVSEPVGNSEQLNQSGENTEMGAHLTNEVSKENKVLDPRNMSDDERAKRGDMLRNAPAVDVNEGVITSTKELSARKAAEKWWDENVPEPVFYDTEVGEVEIGRSSVESSLAHRYGQAKLDAITSLIDGFENAVYLGSMPDSTRHGGVVNHYFAYPINYKGKRCYVFCRAMQDANKNRLYVHEVFIADNIKKGDTLQTAASQPHGGIALYKDILANVLDVESTSVAEDRNSVSNSQENSVKSGENTQNEGEISQGIEDNSTNGGESGSSEIPNNSTISQESEQVGEQVEDEKVLSESEYADVRSAEIMADNINLDDVEAYNMALDEYPKYIGDMIKSGKLSQIYKKATVGERIALNKMIQAAGYEISDVNTQEVKEDSKKAESKFKVGDVVTATFGDGSVVSGAIEKIEDGKIKIRSNGRLYPVDESKIGKGVELQRGSLSLESENPAFAVATEKTMQALEKTGVEVVMATEEQVNAMMGADFSRAAAPFYSNARKAVLDIKQEKATPAQWVAMLKKNGGLKAGEDAWVGLEDWLNNQQGTVTKQEILDYLTENSIQIDEVEYDENAIDIDNVFEEYEEIYDLKGEEEAHKVMIERYGENFFEAFKEIGGELRVQNDKLALQILKNEINSTRLNYTTDGLENKREIALVVPTVESWNASDNIHFGDAGGGRAVAWVRFGETTADTDETIAAKKAVNDYLAEMREKYNTLEGEETDAMTAEEIKHLQELTAKEIESGEKKARVLVIDEIQSKRHQEGREKGYKNPNAEAELEKAEDAYREAIKTEKAYNAELKEKYSYDSLEGSLFQRTEQFVNSLTEEEKAKRNELKRKKEELAAVYDNLLKSLNGKGVPSAPFEKNWHELAMKRMLRLAAEEGFDKVAWTTGEQQARRYNIGNAVEGIDVAPYKAPDSDAIEWFDVGINAGTSSIDLRVDTDGNIVSGGNRNMNLSGEKLANVVGKELAEKIISSKEEVTLQGDGLRIGGEGMKGFYDKMLPSFVQKYTKKWGAKVGEVTMPGLKENNTMHSVDVTPEMRESVMQGQPMFHRVYHGSGAKFDRFDHSFMGAGEGAQVFGWGTYVTEVEGIGKQYAKSLAKPRLSYKGEMVDSEDFNNPWRIIKDLYDENHGRLRDMRTRAERIAGLVEEDNTEMKELWAEVNRLLGEVRAGDLKIVPGRNLYSVEIPDDNGSNYLYWEKPINGEIQERVANGLQSIGFEFEPEMNHLAYSRDGKIAVLNINAKGKELYAELSEALGGDKAASQFLNDLGFVGISYPAEAMTGGREDGARNYVIFNENDAQITDRVEFLRTANGTVYGWTVNGKIYLTPDGINPNTPVHEYTHLWASAIEQNDPKLWSKIVEAMKQSPVWNEVMADEAYRDIWNDDNRVSSEVLSRLSGNENYRRTMQEAAEGENDPTKKFGLIAALGRVKRALADFWNAIKDLFGADNATPWQEFVNSAIGDFYKGVNPNVQSSPMEGMFIGEKGATNLDKAEEATIRLDNLAIAREMEAAEKDAKSIKMATGWERGADGKWRYETDDVRVNKDAKLFSLEDYESFPIAKSIEDGRVNTNSTVKLSKLVNDKELFSAYPEMNEYFVSFEKMAAETKGSHNFVDRVIRINKDDIGSLDSTLAHEIQHAIQSIEGFAKGGNSSTVAPMVQTFREEVYPLHNMMLDTPEWAEKKRLQNRWLDEWDKTAPDETYMAQLQERIDEIDNSGVLKKIEQKQAELIKKYGYNKTVVDIISEPYSEDAEIWNNLPEDFYDRYEAYHRLAGEVESRNVQKRMNMSAEERRASLAEKTEDVARKDQIFLYDNLGESAMIAESERQKPFHDMIDDLYSNGNVDKSKYARTYFHVAETPAFMENIGLVGAEFTIPFKAISTHIGKDADHKLTADIWHELPNALQHPFLVTKYGEDGRFRIYTTLLHNGKYVAVGVDVKRINQGRNKPIVEINSIKTVFAKTGRIGENETVVCYDERITPEQEALLDGRNFRQYPTIQELSADKGSENISNSQENNDIRSRSVGGNGGYDFRPKRGESTEQRENRMNNYTNEIIAILKERGFDVTNSRSRTSFGMSNYVNVYSPEGRFLEKIRISDHSVLRNSRVLDEYNPLPTQSPADVVADLFGNNTGDMYREGEGAYSDEEINFANDPVSKVLGKPRGTKKKQREFAARQRQRMAERVESLAKKLHLDNVEIITDASALEGKKQRAKGFYSKSTGKITVVIPNHSSAFDVEQTLLHEAVAHYGLRQLFGEHFDTFLDNVLKNADVSIRKRIIELAQKKNWDLRTATEEYLASLAEETNFENTSASWWRQIKELFLNMLHKIGFEDFGGVTLSDNELRYILWRSYENLAEPGKFRSILGEVSDIAKQYELGIGNYAQNSTDASTAAENNDLFRDGDSYSDAVSNEKESALSKIEAARKKRLEDIRLVGTSIEKMLDLMRTQKEYDRTTVETLVKLANNILDMGLVSELSRYEIKRLLAPIVRGVGQKNLTRRINEIVNALLDAQLAACEHLLDKQLKIKGSKITNKGVEAQGSLDAQGQQVLTAFKEGRLLDKKSLTQRLADALNRMGDDSSNVASVAAAEYQGLLLAQKYREDITDSVTEGRELHVEIINARESKAAGNMSAKAFSEFKLATEEAILKNKMERVDAYLSFLGMLSGTMKGSVDRAKEFRKEEVERVREIQHNANSDMEGRTAAHTSNPKMEWFYNNPIVRFFMNPLATFDYMLRRFGDKSVKGEGYLWNRFMGGYIKANDEAWKGLYSSLQELDAKVSEVFGKKMEWADLFYKARYMPKALVTMWNGEKMEEFTITQGNMLYIYMVNKMEDGQMKLRKMGITESVVDELTKKIDPRLKDIADWVQDTFLKNKRNKYNEVYERMFGAPMAAIENYFPLVINSRSRGQEVDISEPGKEETTPSTITGSIIKRRRNSLPLDILNADAFDVVTEHLRKMEHWAAFAEYSRDLNALLSYNRFKNQVLNMSTLRFGAGTELWRNFQKVASISAGAYTPAGGKSSFDKAAVNISKGVTAAKISFRIFTAFKQLLSAPAYLASADWRELVKSFFSMKESWNWAIKELPGFAERWQSRMAGNEKLKSSDVDWDVWKNKYLQNLQKYGMATNAAIDAATVAFGANAIYHTALKRYKDAGFSEEEAKKKALNEASVLFNETQQSSEGAYMSPMQMDRTLAANALTIYRNASMGYQRKLMQSVYELKRMAAKGYKEESVEFMAKQYEREGLTKEQARIFAEEEYKNSLARNLANVAVFGFILQFAWNLGAYLPYLIFGDDDDKKGEMIGDAAVLALCGGWVEGLSGGNIISGALFSATEGDLSKFTTTTLPIISELEQIVKSKDPVKALEMAVNLLVQSGIGTNPQTLSDAIVGIIDFAKAEDKTFEEATILFLRIINAPQSSINQLLLDRVEDVGTEIKEGARFAEYQMQRNYPFTNRFQTDEGYQERRGKYLKRFDELYKERVGIGTENIEDVNALIDAENSTREKDLLFKEQKKVLEKDKPNKEDFKQLDAVEQMTEMLNLGNINYENYIRLSTAADGEDDYQVKTIESKLKKKYNKFKELEGDAKLEYYNQNKKDLDLYLDSIRPRINSISKSKKNMELNPNNAEEWMQIIRENRQKIINTYGNE